ncbi:MAG: hypothetical protein F6K40_23850 [Okeania sp. SIO3I5]|uniref:hypothetical protein n=1 Tax=Okeania sp. SIO3I5 TaxID=2607805 RepID=UPI0013BC470B|nr:hypothetical protein [Okeania sp. SIO3I5]NEQ39123.1 hypothetical protein [Okeania sp. SIO3I5]
MNKYVGASMRIAPRLGNGSGAIASFAQVENNKNLSDRLTNDQQSNRWMDSISLIFSQISDTSV